MVKQVLLNNLKTIKKNSYLLLFLITIPIFLYSCSSDQKYQRRFFTLDTIIDVTFFSSSHRDFLLDSLEQLITRVDSTLSISNPQSEIWKVNHRKGNLVNLHPITMSIIKFCIAEYDSSGGLFDITVAPLKFLYGLEAHQKENRVPSQVELDSIRQFIGCSHLKIIDDSTLHIDSGVTIDFGGIAKGYLLQNIQELFTRAGEKRFLVNLGGDLIAWGEKPDHNKWNIGIQHPRSTENLTLLATMPVTNTCVFSSGDYERFYIQDGVRYHHLFNPITEIPGRKNQSSTVIGEDPLFVDVCVKEAFLMDAQQAIDFIKKRNLEGVIVDSAGKVWATANLKGILVPTPSIVVNYQ